MRFRQQYSGFSLIELLTAVAVAGILAAVALPSYQSYVRRGKIAEATSGLADLRIKLEQHFQDNRKYDGYVDAGCNRISDGKPAIADAKYFTYTCDTQSTTYKITADGATSQAVGGYQYTLDQNNMKSSQIPGATGSGCWITKPGESC